MCIHTYICIHAYTYTHIYTHPHIFIPCLSSSEAKPTRQWGIIKSRSCFLYLLASFSVNGLAHLLYAVFAS